MNVGACGHREHVEALVALRARDQLDRAGREELLAHLASCASCREAALGADPTLLFAPLASPVRGRERAAESLVHDVMAAVTVVRRERGLAQARRRTLLRLAAAFTGLSLLTAWAVRSRLEPAPEVVMQSPAPTALPARPDPLPPIEGVGSPEARVYQFTASGEPTVVFVVDRNADI